MSLSTSRLKLSCALALLFLPGFAAAQSASAIRYTLTFPAPQTHYVEVDAVVPTDGQTQVDLMMAVWTPGSYLVREYEKNVEGVTAKARDGRALSIEKTLRNRWRRESFESARAGYPRGSSSTNPGIRSRCSSRGATN